MEKNPIPEVGTRISEPGTHGLRRYNLSRQEPVFREAPAVKRGN